MAANQPWASFCISTFKRPDFLKAQLASLLQQQFPDFEIVVSDNDPEGSADAVANAFGDQRIRYFHNVGNLGMIRSFNKSIERARGEYVVMVTDDDPVATSFLEQVHQLVSAHPGYTLYGGFHRVATAAGALELIPASQCMAEILDPRKTANLLWSSCLLQREAVLAVGCIPDYGSPHLADHALLTLTACRGGAVVVNNMYSSLSSHDNNFSKFNFDYYLKGCTGFYATMTGIALPGNPQLNHQVLLRHLGTWLIANMFNLKRYYTRTRFDPAVLAAIDDCARQILALPYMKRFATRYFLKERIYRVKKYFWTRKKQ